MQDARKCKCWKLKSLHAGSSKIYMLEAQKFTCWRLKNLHAESTHEKSRIGSVHKKEAWDLYMKQGAVDRDMKKELWIET